MERARSAYEVEQARVAKCAVEEERKWVRRREDAGAAPRSIRHSRRRGSPATATAARPRAPQLQKDADRAKARFDVEICDYLLRLNDSEMRRRVYVMNSLTELYSVQTTFFEENLATMSSLAGYMKGLVAQTAQVRVPARPRAALRPAIPDHARPSSRGLRRASTPTQTKNAFLEERRLIEEAREQIGRIEGMVRAPRAPVDDSTKR